MSKTLYVAGKYGDIADVFRSPEDNVVILDNTSHRSYEKFVGGKNDVLILGGGEDINPHLYTRKPSRFSCPVWGTDPGSYSDRDQVERNLIHVAKERGMKIVGVCRGAQMLFVCLGGGLIQHVTGHGEDHPVFFTGSGEDVYYRMGEAAIPDPVVSISSHHQMMAANSIRCKVLLGNTHEDRLSKFYVFDDENVVPKGEADGIMSVPEPDIVQITNNYLMIQGHPEWGSKDHVYTKVCQVFFNYIMQGPK